MANVKQALYLAGDESDYANKVIICLLLSFRRRYPSGMFDNEYWLLEAQNILQDAKLNLCQSASAPNQHRSIARWPILHYCVVMRVGCLLVGTRRTSSLLKPLALEQPYVDLRALEEDLEFSWFSTSSTKRLMFEILRARWELWQAKNVLCSNILRQTVDCFQSGTPSVFFRNTSIGELVNLQADLERWRAGHDELLDTIRKLCWKDETNRPVLVQYTDLMLCYE